MKNAILILLALLSTTAIYAMDDKPYNEEYLLSVREASTPDHILESQTMVSNYDVTKSEGFEGRKVPFETVFRFSKGTITAKYDHSGELMSSMEDFTDVRLPAEVRNEVFSQYGEDWEMVQNRYSVHYSRGKDAEIFYTIKLRNGNKVERIKVDADLFITKA